MKIGKIYGNWKNCEGVVADRDLDQSLIFPVIVLAVLAFKKYKKTEDTLWSSVIIQFAS